MHVGGNLRDQSPRLSQTTSPILKRSWNSQSDFQVFVHEILPICMIYDPHFHELLWEKTKRNPSKFAAFINETETGEHIRWDPQCFDVVPRGFGTRMFVHVHDLGPILLQ